MHTHIRDLAGACALALAAHVAPLQAQDDPRMSMPVATSRIDRVDQSTSTTASPSAGDQAPTATEPQSPHVAPREHAEGPDHPDRSGHARHDEHAAHEDHTRQDETTAGQAKMMPKTPVPSPTDADRAAAFPAVSAHGEHGEHGDRMIAMLLVDRIEARSDNGAHGEHGRHWKLHAWAGGDVQRVWLRSEGEYEDGTTRKADIELFYGRSLTPWWDLLAGVRHDSAPGPDQSWAAIGVQGIAPYKFEIEATAYLGPGGRSAARFEAEYELLLSNRLILQPSLELELRDRRDRRGDTAAGLNRAEAGLRLRYEITRRFAPYLGLVHERIETAEGHEKRETRLVGGLRLWF